MAGSSEQTKTVEVADKKEAHELIDRMPTEEMPAVMEWLRSRIEEFDDEPLTAEDLERLREGKAALNQPERWVSMEDVLADFGLTNDDFPLKK